MTCNVYWIRCKDHTDVFNQGYVGVSSNPEVRWQEHLKYTQNTHLKNAILKYGWDELVKEVIVKGDEQYCLEVEKALRNADKIGWNLCMGGGIPPSMLGRKRPEHAAKLRGRKRPEHAAKISGANHPKAIQVKFDAKVFDTIQDLANYLNKNYATIRNRVMQNPQRWGYEVLK